MTIATFEHLRGAWRAAAFATVSLGALAAAPAVQAAGATPTAREQAALDVRFLQTELMVAALSCGRSDFHQSYNAFVTKFGPALKLHGSALKAYFSRQYGSQGVSKLDSFATKLANEASLRSMQQANFCHDSGMLMQRAVELHPTSLESFSASVARNFETVAAGPAAR